ncbi:MAG: Gldg family protein [Oscillospiraceae bacterium]|nr:Gldg family protein [Oscillospiraceae bacterium]
MKKEMKKKIDAAQEAAQQTAAQADEIAEKAADDAAKAAETARQADETAEKAADDAAQEAAQQTAAQADEIAEKAADDAAKTAETAADDDAGKSPAPKKIRDALREMFSTRAYRSGARSSLMTVIVAAIALVAVLLVGLLPDSVAKIDISASKVYTIGDVTKELLAGLTDDVKLTVIAVPDELDVRIDKLVKQYVQNSDHITSEIVDPVSDPGTVSSLGASENTILVTNEATGKSRTVSFDDIIQYDEYSYYYSGTKTETAFDGEGQLTSAINAVCTSNSELVCFTEGHGETAVATTVQDRLTKLSLASDSVNLLLDGGIPAGCTLLVFNGPTADLADDEAAMVRAYLAAGGNVMYVGAAQPVRLANFESILSEYGIAPVDGYIADPSRCYQNAYYIFPELGNSGDIVGSLSSDALVLLINTGGFAMPDGADESVTTDTFLTTTDGGLAVTETAQTEGEYALGISAEKKADDGTVSHVVALSSINLIDSSVTSAFTNVSNVDVYVNAVASFFGDVANVSIDAKSLQVPTNALTGGTFYRLLFVFVIPLALLIGGFVVWNRRRKA